jgi:YbgC/YbaW family acyl-CoA thioester hydrolase
LSDALLGRECSVPIVVEFEDVDAYRIAHHAKLILYFERARVRFFTSLGFDLFHATINPVMYRLAVEYKKPALLMDRLEATVRVLAVDDYRVEMGYRLTRGDELIAKATSTLAFMDIATRQLVPVPQVG